MVSSPTAGLLILAIRPAPQGGHQMIRTALLLSAVGLAFAGCVEQEPDRPSAADWNKIKANILKTAPTPRYKVNASFEGKVEYLGLDVDKQTVRPGQPFTLTHYWRVKKAIPGWRLFVHLGDEKNRPNYFVNADHKPIENKYPVTMWKAGEIIRDRHRVTLRGNWDAPEVRVFVGLWRGKQRMKPSKNSDGKNRLIAATIPVKVTKKPKKVRPVRRLVARQIKEAIKIDGKLDEAAWKKAMRSPAFVDIVSGGRARLMTTVQALWDDKNLYLAFTCQDNDIWSTLKKRDDKLWTQEAVEIFIDANGDKKDYIELQINPQGAIFDSYLPSYRKNDNGWNSQMKVAVKVDGTVDKRGDKDKSWVVELALPLKDAKGKGTYELKTPTVGTVWRANFIRVDTPKKSRPQYTAWSPPLVGDPHKLDAFGTLHFADAEGKLPAPKKPIKATVTPKTAGKMLRIAKPHVPGRLRSRNIKRIVPPKGKLVKKEKK
jgi:hypothetical protein